MTSKQAGRHQHATRGAERSLEDTSVPKAQKPASSAAAMSRATSKHTQVCAMITGRSWRYPASSSVLQQTLTHYMSLVQVC